MTEIEMLEKENQLLKEQIELYKKLLEEKDKKKEKEYIPLPYQTYPDSRTYPSITWEPPFGSSLDNIFIKC